MTKWTYYIWIQLWWCFFQVNVDIMFTSSLNPSLGFCLGLHILHMIHHCKGWGKLVQKRLGTVIEIMHTTVKSISFFKYKNCNYTQYFDPLCTHFRQERPSLDSYQGQSKQLSKLQKCSIFCFIMYTFRSAVVFPTVFGDCMVTNCTPLPAESLLQLWWKHSCD